MSVTKSQASWPILRAQINRELSEFQRSPVDLAIRAGIDYHAARRFLLNGVTNQTQNAQKVAEALAVSQKKLQESQKRLPPTLEQGILDVWDGSEDHCELIKQLAEVTSRFRIKKKS